MVVLAHWDYLEMIRDYPQYGHDWEIIDGTSIVGQGLSNQSGIVRRQLGLGIGYHKTAGSRQYDYWWNNNAGYRHIQSGSVLKDNVHKPEHGGFANSIGFSETQYKNSGSRDYFQGSDGWNHSWNIDMMNRACLHDPYGVSMNYERCGICTVGVCARNDVVIVQGSR